MRAFLIALMIALLPLRGWVGDAMAADLALASLPHQAMSVAAPVSPTTLHADCALHAASDAATPDDDGDQGAGCTACQVCHTLAVEARAQTVSLPAISFQIIPQPACNFASAERALSVKPPIA
jgi:hypothetical protein